MYRSVLSFLRKMVIFYTENCYFRSNFVCDINVINGGIWCC